MAKAHQLMPKPAAIEDAIPLPPRANVKSYGLTVDLVATIRALKPGQSFVVDSPDGRERALKMGIRLEVELTSRSIENGRFRIWRKPKEEK